MDEFGGQGAGKQRRGVGDTGKPTTLSLIKGVGSNRPDATQAKIAKLEAKLRQMEQSDGGSSSRAHASLPAKPVNLTVAPTSGRQPANASSHKGKSVTRSHPQLPSLPIAHRSPSSSSQDPNRPLSAALPFQTGETGPVPRRSVLSGVKIVKQKDKR